MGWSYNRLWFQLIERKMTRTELRIAAGLSTSALAHMGKDEPVSMDNLARICQTLHCRVEDIVEFIPDPAENE